METKDAIAYYGSIRRLAEALGITTTAVYQWGPRVPELRAFQLERMTGGSLRAEPRREEASP